MKRCASSFALLAVMLIASGFSEDSAFRVQAQSISSIVGTRWSGQPASAPSTASNQYKGYLQIDTWPISKLSDSTTVWTINGTGFGTTKGQVGIIGPIPVGIASIESWSNTQIRVRVFGLWYFSSFRNAKVFVRTASGRTAEKADNWVAAPKGRGYGQCTWEVFYRRVGAGLSAPASAYPSSTIITGSYVPRQWDVLFWGTYHTAIITSVPHRVTAINGQTTYTFTISERNAKWDEAVSFTTSTFIVQNGSVKQGIKSKLNSTATSYWR